MTITDVKQQVRRKNRYSIFIDGKYSFSLSGSDVLDEKIVKDKALTVADIRRLQKLSKLGVSYEKLLHFLSIRFRSRKEIDDYLKRKGATEEDKRVLIQKLERAQLIDDERFAEAWINKRRKTTRASEKRIIYELKTKGIESSTITKLLASNDIDEMTSLKELIVKKRRLNRYQDDLKLMRYLISQGYGYGNVKAALTELQPGARN